MNIDEALEQAVCGEKVRAVDMAPGTYLDYHFDGFRINLAGGSSSGYRLKETDKAVAWEVYTPPAPAAPAWDMSKVNPAPAAPAVKRRGRKPSFVPPAVIDDVDYGTPTTPTEPVKPLSNPWLEAGLTSQPPAATGWATFKPKD
jgi:hypothetical protein